MSSNARKSLGGNTKRLICRERGDVRDKILEIITMSDTEHAVIEALNEVHALIGKAAYGDASNG